MHCLLIAAITSLSCTAQGVTQTPQRPNDTIATGFIYFNVQYDGAQRPCVIYVPPDYTPDKAWPLIVFLHGFGERGNDGWKETLIGLPSEIRHHPDRFPCLVLMPQCPMDSFWGKWDNPLGKSLKDATPLIDVALKKTKEMYHVDPNRMVLTGLSMGGFGTWQYGAKHTDEYAAFMPVCGGGFVKDAPALAKRPVWAFHGGADDTVPVQRSREMVAAIKKAGGDVHYTEYKGVGHNSWEKAYADPKAIEWLLSQKLNK